MGSTCVHTMLRVRDRVLPVWLPKGKGDVAPSPSAQEMPQRSH